MKREPKTKLDKSKTATPKKIDGDVSLCSQIMSSLFFRFIAVLEQSGSRISDA